MPSERNRILGEVRLKTLIRHTTEKNQEWLGRKQADSSESQGVISGMLSRPNTPELPNAHCPEVAEAVSLQTRGARGGYLGILQS